MKRIVVVILSALALSACSTMQPPRYAVSVDNVQILKQYEGAKASVSSLTQTANFDANCRLMGPIEPADGLTIPEFIAKAINDEFKMSEVYSPEGNQISGEITKIEFSSMDGLTNGYWDIGITLRSTNGRALSVDNKYSFKSGFDAITACNATADALTPAVQDLINATVANPEFASLIGDS